MDALSRAQAARAAWPDVDWPAESFARRLGDGHHDADLYLADACVHQAPGALAAFERGFVPLIPGYLARISPAPAFTDEVQQLLREKLFVGTPPKIAEYAGQGPLGAWLRVVALRIALDLLRARGQRPAPDPDRFTEPLSQTPEMEYLKTRYLADVKSAFAEAMRALTSEERNLLRLHLVDGLTLEEMGQLFQVNRSTVFRWIAAARERVLEDARRRLRERLGVSAEEFDSLTQLVRSRLDLSLDEVLRSR